MPAPWFVPMTDEERPLRVVAFPHAGAGCGAFAECATRLDTSIALYGLNLPGRQARFTEPPETDLTALTTVLVDELAALTGQPYVLFGYCSGALLAYCVLRAALAADLPPPRSFVVGAYPAPHLARPDPELHLAPADELWAQALETGGFSSVLVAQPAFREVFEPALRADYELLGGFRYVAGSPLPIPIVGVIGRHDPLLSDALVRPWARHTDRRFRVETLEADHWLLDRDLPGLIGVLEAECHPRSPRT